MYKMLKKLQRDPPQVQCAPLNDAERERVNFMRLIMLGDYYTLTLSRGA